MIQIAYQYINFYVKIWQCQEISIHKSKKKGNIHECLAVNDKLCMFPCQFHSRS